MLKSILWTVTTSGDKTLTQFENVFKTEALPEDATTVSAQVVFNLETINNTDATACFELDIDSLKKKQACKFHVSIDTSTNYVTFAQSTMQF